MGACLLILVPEPARPWQYPGAETYNWLTIPMRYAQTSAAGISRQHVNGTTESVFVLLDSSSSSSSFYSRLAPDTL